MRRLFWILAGAAFAATPAWSEIQNSGKVCAARRVSWMEQLSVLPLGIIAGIALGCARARVAQKYPRAVSWLAGLHVLLIALTLELMRRAMDLRKTLSLIGRHCGGDLSGHWTSAELATVALASSLATLCVLHARARPLASDCLDGKRG